MTQDISVLMNLSLPSPTMFSPSPAAVKRLSTPASAANEEARNGAETPKEDCDAASALMNLLSPGGSEPSSPQAGEDVFLKAAPSRSKAAAAADGLAAHFAEDQQEVSEEAAAAPLRKVDCITPDGLLEIDCAEGSASSSSVHTEELTADGTVVTVTPSSSEKVAVAAAAEAKEVSGLPVFEGQQGAVSAAPSSNEGDCSAADPSSSSTTESRLGDAEVVMR